MQGILLVLWLICIPGVLTGIVLIAASQKTFKAGLITLLTSIVLLLIIPSICNGLGWMNIH